MFPIQKDFNFQSLPDLELEGNNKPQNLVFSKFVDTIRAPILGYVAFKSGEVKYLQILHLGYPGINH